MKIFPNLTVSWPNYSKLLVLLLALIVAFGVAEVSLRIFWHPDYLNPAYLRDDLTWLSRNVVLNDFGYRDREFSLQRNDETFRIYSLGDSYTYGWYINDANAAYPKLLERKLKDQFGDTKVEVINAARPGFNLAAEVERFENEGILFRPNLVTIGLNAQDLATREYPPHFTKNKLLVSLKLYQLVGGNLERARVAKMTDQEIKETYTDGSEQLVKAEKLLAKLKSLTDSIEAELVIVVFPQYNPSQPDEIYRYPQYHEQLAKLGEKYQIKVVDLLTIFNAQQDRRKLVLNPIDPHPSKLANEIVADYLIQSVNFVEKINRPHQPIPISHTSVTMGTKLSSAKGIISYPSGWVFFDRKFNLATQKLPLLQEGSKQVSYMEDILKTARSYTHEGWPGAKIETHLKGRTNKLTIPKTLYGYQVVGVSQVTAFWKKNGALHSQDLSLTEVGISKNEDFINIEVFSDREFELYRVTVDIAINQLDIDKEEVVSLFSTKIYQDKVDKDQQQVAFNSKGEIGSLPKFFWAGKSVNYAWVDNKMTALEIKKIEQQVIIRLPDRSDRTVIELPIAEINSFDETGSPLIEFF